MKKQFLIVMLVVALTGAFALNAAMESQDTDVVPVKSSTDLPDPGPYNEVLDQNDQGALVAPDRPETAMDPSVTQHAVADNVLVEDAEEGIEYDPGVATYDVAVAPTHEKPGTHIADPDKPKM